MSAPGQRPVLSLEGVGKTFRRRGAGSVSKAALDDFSLSFPDSEAKIVAVAGESGSGKTTAANIALGFLTPSSGQALHRGRPIDGLTKSEVTEFRDEVQAITQDPFAAFNPYHGVRHVFDVALRNFNIADDKGEGKRMVEESLEFVGLEPERVLRSYPHQLSGGERQRIMVARAFLIKPRLIIADEPVSMVDASIRATILELMMRMRSELSVSFMYITHDLSTAYSVADELVILKDGVTMERGPVREVVDNPSNAYTKLLIGSIPIPDPDQRWGAADS